MKKIITLISIALVSMGVFAQGGKQHHERTNFTPEQIADLRTKKMTLHLDLTEKQQTQIFEINKQRAIEHKAKMAERKAMKEEGKKPSSEEHYKMKATRLEKAIVLKAEMKNILSEEQFEKWEKMAKRKAHHMKGKRGEHAKKGRKARKEEK